MTNTECRLSFRYRFLFYFGGFLFASASYILGFWAYQSQTDVLRNIQFYTSLKNFFDNFGAHNFSLFIWETLCIGIASTIGYLFDREVYYRRKAEQKANIDGLTDIYNHRYFQERLSSEMERAHRYERVLSVIMFDLDNFKTYNDTWGHQDGDKLLMWFADICGKHIRNIDVLARYGGEEFVVILPETPSAEALDVAERIRISIEKQSIGAFGKGRSATVSAGVASFPCDGKTRHSLILNADAALYYAKQQGKNKCFVYEQECQKSYRASSSHIKPLLRDDDMDAIEALGTAVDSKDSHMKGHSIAVMHSCVALGEKLGMSAEEISNLRAAALLHDLGKIGIPEEVLEKSGPLEKEEWQQIENHAGLGSKILKRVQQMGSIVPGVQHHHERYDGKGYPNGLSGKEIPLLARIIAIADAFDAMTNARSYRQAMKIDDAIEELKHCAGTQFDPELVESFVRMVEQSIREENAA